MYFPSKNTQRILKIQEVDKMVLSLLTKLTLIYCVWWRSCFERMWGSAEPHSKSEVVWTSFLHHTCQCSLLNFLKTKPCKANSTIWYANNISKPMPAEVSTFSVVVILKPWSTMPFSSQGPRCSIAILHVEVNLFEATIPTSFTTRLKLSSWPPLRFMELMITHAVRSKTWNLHRHTVAEVADILHLIFDSSNSDAKTSKQAAEAQDSFKFAAWAELMMTRPIRKRKGSVCHGGAHSLRLPSQQSSHRDRWFF